MLNGKRVVSFLMSLVLVCALLFHTISSFAYTEKKATIKYDIVNIRSGAGTSYSVVSKLSLGKELTIVGEKNTSDGYIWYQVTYTVSGETKKGWVRSDCITIQESVTTDQAFETYLSQQGFPETYKVKLRQLHAKYPKWKFVAQNTKLTWADVITAESALGLNTIQNSSISSWKSTQTGAYNWDTSTWIELDSGNWVAASSGLISYYMDPRNMLDETYIFQFLSQKYDGTQQTKAGLQNVVKGTFLAGSYTESGATKSYVDTLMSAGKSSGVSP